MSKKIIDALKCPCCGQWIADIGSQDKVPERLTDKQLQVLLMVAYGHQTKSIAHKIGIKPVTVSLHLRAIRRKLNAKTNAHAVFLYFEGLTNETGVES